MEHWPWKYENGIEMLRIFRPDLVVVEKQRELRDCAVVTVEMLLRYLEHIGDATHPLPSYEEILLEFRTSEVATATNVRRYVSGETVVDFFDRRVMSPVGRRLVQKTARSFEDLMREIVDTRLPILVSYMTDVSSPMWAIPANLLLTLPNIVSAGCVGKWFTGGESYVLNDYLHSAVVLAVVKVDATRCVLLADPWSGFTHSRARGLVWVEEENFCECWLGYDQRGARLPWVDSYYESEVKAEFNRLGGPGGMLVLGKKGT